MSQPVKEAELEHTKMSFGEHLEELRRALWKSILALIVGFLVGLCIGFPLVDYIQEPLRRTLRDYHMRRAETKQLAYLEQQRDAGVKVPENLSAAAHEQVVNGGVPHEYLVRTEELAASLEKTYPASPPSCGKNPRRPPQPQAGTPTSPPRRRPRPARSASDSTSRWPTTIASTRSPPASSSRWSSTSRRRSPRGW